jgi:hypothetical protein
MKESAIALIPNIPSLKQRPLLPGSVRMNHRFTDTFACAAFPVSLPKSDSASKQRTHQACRGCKRAHFERQEERLATRQFAAR